MADNSVPSKILKPVFGLFAVVGWLLLIGLHLVWHYTFGWLLTTLADLLDAVSIPTGFFGRKHLFGTVSAWLRSLDRNVDNALVHAANGLEHTAVWLFSRVGWLIGRAGHELKALGLAVEHKFTRLVSVTIPRLLKRLLSLVWKELRALGKYARKMIPKLARQILRFTRWAAHEIAKGAKHLGFLWKWIKAVLKLHWRVIKGALKRLLAIERALTPKGFRKLLVAALGPLGLLWLFTDNIKSVAGWIMHLDRSAIWEFVEDQVEIAAKENICVLNAFAYDIALYVVEPVIRQEVALLHWLCQPDKNSLPWGCEYPTVYKGAWEPHGTPLDHGAFAEERLAPGLPLPGGVIKA